MRNRYALRLGLASARPSSSSVRIASNVRLADPEANSTLRFTDAGLVVAATGGACTAWLAGVAWLGGPPCGPMRIPRVLSLMPGAGVSDLRICSEVGFCWGCAKVGQSALTARSAEARTICARMDVSLFSVVDRKS